MAVGLVPVSSLQSSESVSLDVMAASNALLADTIANASYDFLRASPNLHEAALLAAKHYLDPLAASISHVQVTRLQEARRKRKRGDTRVDESVLRLRQLYIEDFSTEQIWEQSKRILDASTREAQLILQSDSASANATVLPQKRVRFMDGDIASDESLNSERGADVESESENDEIEELAVSGNGSADETNENDIDDVSDIEDGDSSLVEDDEGGQLSRSTFTKDKHGLNDGFFSIDDFNRATEFLEQVDARGDPDDGAASDEEDVDWAVDPMNQPLSNTTQTRQTAVTSRISDDGPTFGDADLNAPWSDDENDEDEDEEDIEMNDDMEENTNEIYYKDFFAPPPRALTKTKRMRPLPKTQPAEPNDEEIQRTMSAVHRDIFSDDDIEGSDLSDDQASQHLSTHERRQKALAEQIRKLEAEAIAKREWTMIGEARAIDRPVNSLLEDNLVLDFERAGKPIPEATAAVTEAIEDLIKSRILARNFDEIPKRRAGLDTNSSQTRRGLIELDDRKNTQSLAEIYETEHLKATDPNYVDTRDAETKKAHQEIETLWKSVSAKLDALCSWHYKPKPADMEVRVMTDAPRVQMEDARPAGVSIAAEESGLAPQEVYRVGEELGGKHGDANVVLTTGGALVARNELTREQKLRRRRREKERIKKKGSGNVATTASQPVTNNDMPGKRVKKAAEKKNILDELRRGNVKVIGKGGVVQDVEGRKAQAGSDGVMKGGGLKL